MSVTPFAGYVRDPNTVSDAPTPAAFQALIDRAAGADAGLKRALELVWHWEAGGQANPHQEVGVNSSGFGGFLGLPSSLLGSAEQQVATTAGLLKQYQAQTGSWQAAVNIYNTGDPSKGYGSQLDAPHTWPTPTPVATPAFYMPPGSAPKVVPNIVSGGLGGTILDPAWWAHAWLNLAGTVLGVGLIAFGLYKMTGIVPTPANIAAQAAGAVTKNERAVEHREG